MQNCFEIPHKLITLNEYIKHERCNKYKAAIIKERYTNLCCVYALKMKSLPNKLYDINIKWYGNYRHDSDNIFFAVKFILDGIVKAKRLKSDNKKNIRHISHERCESKKLKTIVSFILVK